MLEWQDNKSRIQKVKLHSYTELSVLVLEINTDIHFCMLLKRLDLIEETHSFIVLHRNRSITNTINDPDSILVCLSTVQHKSLELGLRDTMLCHYIV
jgi:hypothetical protein